RKGAARTGAARSSGRSCRAGGDPVGGGPRRHGTIGLRPGNHRGNSGAGYPGRGQSLMFISDFAIQRPIVTITAMVALVAFGIAALLNLHTDEFPDIQQPVIGVTISYPGASPETVEREIIDPIEESFSSISGLDWSKTQASATDGLGQFIVFFDFEKDIQEASQDIRDAISTKRADLPTEMKEP